MRSAQIFSPPPILITLSRMARYSTLHAVCVKSLLKPGSESRLVIILCFSLFLHLTILSVLSEPLSGSGHATHEQKTDAPHRLTVTLANATPVIASREAKEIIKEKNPSPDIAAADTASNGVNNKQAPKDDQPVSLAEGVLPAVDSRYFSLAELDQIPVVIQDIPENPPDLWAHTNGGKIVLRLWIDKTGNVTNVEPINSELPQGFIDNARRNFLKTTFVPGRKSGSEVNSVMDIVIHYVPVNREANVQP